MLFIQFFFKNLCFVVQDKLLQAREALKRYHWAVQGAESFFQQIRSNLMIPSDGFKGYKEEHRYIQQIFSTLVEGFQIRLSEVGASVPQQTCLSIPLTEQLHIKVLSHLLVQDAKLEAQAQLRLEALQRLVILYKAHYGMFFYKNLMTLSYDSDCCFHNSLRLLLTFPYLIGR